MTDTPDSKGNISVLVSAPTFDLSPYHLFSEDIFQHTVDKILSDEGSFEGNFDDYSPICDQGKNGDVGSGVDDKQGHDQKKVKKRDMQEQKQRRKQNRKEPKRTNAAGGTRSKYFIKETIDGIPCIDLESPPGPESPVEERENGKNADTNTNMDMNIPSLDDNPSALVDDSAVEDIIFSSVSPEVRDKLLHFIVAHPFTREAQYPVKRSARRRFVDDIRGEAVASGMDEGSIAGLIGYVRNTYLELYGNRTGLPGGSTFGEEIDDDESAEEKSDRKKRTWLSRNKKKEESRSGGTKKRVSMVSESGSLGPRNGTQTGDIGAETVQVEHIVFGPASASSMSSAENASNIHNGSEQNSHVSGDCLSTAEQARYPPNGFDDDAQVQEVVTMHEPGSPLRDLNGKVEVLEQRESHERPSESILEKQTLCLPFSETLDGPMTPSKTPNDKNRRRRERNLRKRLARKKRRAEKRLRLNFIESETDQPVGQLSAGADDIERDTSSLAPPSTLGFQCPMIRKT
ncbi:hypothetical protein MAP00_001003 [Monascus purpureus]|nr:hypothetical protein MAP00_001003 [Monascus purpureus]